MNSVAKRFGFNGMELEDSDIGGDALDLYEMDVRSYDPAIARWTSIDPVAHFEYSTYSAFDNNPVYWADPSGADSQVHWEGNLAKGVGRADETGGDGDDSQGDEDCCGPGMDLLRVADYYAKENETTLSFELDILLEEFIFLQGEALKEALTWVIPGGMIIKGVFKGGKWVYRIYKGTKLIKTASLSLKTFTHASRFGVQNYKKLKAAIKGTGLEAHHLIEKRFANILGLESGKMASIALTKAEHQIFTNAWRAEIGYKNSKAAITTLNATKEQITSAARKIYKDYPEILKVLGL